MLNRIRILFCIFFVVAHFSNAEGDAKKYINIPSKTLTDALIDFSFHYDRVVVGLPHVLKKYRSTEVDGVYTPLEALTIILSGTDLIVQSNTASGFVVSMSRREDARKLEYKNLLEAFEEILVEGRSAIFEKGKLAVSRVNLPRDASELNNLVESENLSLLTPTLFVNLQDTGDANLTLRGIRNFGNANQSTTPVSYHYLNHYVQPQTFSVLPLFDLEKITITKGPQIINKGRSAVSGDVSILPKLAELEKDSTIVELGGGDFDRELFKGVANKSFGDNFSLRLSGRFENKDGFTRLLENYDSAFEQIGIDERPFNYPGLRFSNDGARNQQLKRLEFRNSDSWRASARWRPTENFSVSTSYEKHSLERGATAFVDPIFANEGERVSVAFLQPVVTSDIDLFYSKLNFHNRGLLYEYSFSTIENNRTLLSNNGFQNQFTNTVTVVPNREIDSFAHNLSISNISSKADFYWTFGVYIDSSSDSSDLSFDTFRYNDDGDIDQQSSVLFNQPGFDGDTQDLFLSLTKSVDKFTLAGGARLSKYKITADDFVVSMCDRTLLTYGVGPGFDGVIPRDIFFSDNLLDGEQVNGTNQGNLEGLPCFAFSTLNDSQAQTNINSEVSILYNFHSAHSASMRAAYSSRPGIIQSGGNLNPEKVRSVESRLFGRFDDIRLSYDFSAFINLHDDLHAPGNRYADNDGDGLATDFLFADAQNIAEARSLGAELELNYTDTWGGKSRFNLAYLNTELIEYQASDGIFFFNNPWNPLVDDPFLASLGIRDFSGNALPYSPEWSVQLDYQFSFSIFSGTVTPNLRFKYVGDYFLDLHNRDDIDIVTPDGVVSINNLSRQEAHILADISLNWQTQSKQVSVELFVENITDEVVRTGTNESFFSEAGFASTFLPPRTFGFNVRLSF